MSARDRILGKLRAAAPAQTPVEPDVAGYYARHTLQHALPARLAHFSHMIRAVHTEVIYTRADSWPQALAARAAQAGWRHVLLAPNTAHGARAAQALQGLATPPQLKSYDRPIDDWKAELFHDVDAAFTTTRAGIAETGTLIVWPDADEPRAMSLVPPVHIALFDASRLYENFYQAVSTEGWANGLPTNSLLISGPSKTADIQQTLAYGAHGPRELIVLAIVPDDIDLAELEAAQ